MLDALQEYLLDKPGQYLDESQCLFGMSLRYWSAHDNKPKNTLKYQLDKEDDSPLQIAMSVVTQPR